MQIFATKPQTALFLSAALASFLLMGCDDGDGLTDVSEGMSQSEIDAFMESSKKMEQRVTEAEEAGGRDG